MLAQIDCLVDMFAHRVQNKPSRKHISPDLNNILEGGPPATAVKNNLQNAGWAESLLRYLKDPMHWGLVLHTPIDDQNGLKHCFNHCSQQPPSKKPTAIICNHTLALKKLGIVSSNNSSIE